MRSFNDAAHWSKLSSLSLGNWNEKRSEEDAGACILPEYDEDDDEEEDEDIEGSEDITDS
jgi:hypothetical protein